MTEPVLASNERILLLTPDRNSPPKKDYTGAFKPEALLLAKAYKAVSVSIVEVPVPVVDPTSLTIGSSDKQRGFEEAAAKTIAAVGSGKWTRIVMLCHGWATGIQFGFRTTKQRGRDAANLEALIAVCRASPLQSITLFACSAGDEPASEKTSPGTGDNSFADYLRDALGCFVISHWSVGHSTRNPDLISFAPSPGKSPMLGGVAWPERGTAAYRNAVKLLNPKLGGNRPPKGHTRPAFASIPLCCSVEELQALLSAEPA
jgi:hypothetical protein